MPYNYTVYPNYIGHYSQRDAQMVSDLFNFNFQFKSSGLSSSLLSTVTI